MNTPPKIVVQPVTSSVLFTVAVVPSERALYHFKFNSLVKCDEETMCSKHFFVHLKVKTTLLLNAVSAVHVAQLLALAF